MRLNNSCLATLVITLCWPIQAIAQDVVLVPSSQSRNAVFVKETAGTDGAGREVYRATGPDGSSAVVFGKTLVVGLQNAAFSISFNSDGPLPKIALEHGGFEISVGSKETLLGIGESTLRAREAKLVIVEVGEGYLVYCASFYGSAGEAKVTSSIPPEPAPADGVKDKIDTLRKEIDTLADESNELGGENTSKRELRKLKSERRRRLRHARRELKILEKQVAELPPLTEPEPILRTLSLDIGQAFLVKQNTEPVLVDKQLKSRIEEVQTRLAPHGTSASLLSPMDVEHPSDLVAKMMEKDQAFEDIEIEDIEVEAGCVEVCLD